MGGGVLIALNGFCRCRRFYNKRISVLKNDGFLPEKLNVAENYKGYLKPLPDSFDVSDLKDDKVLMELHLVLVKRYLGKVVIYIFLI